MCETDLEDDDVFEPSSAAEAPPPAAQAPPPAAKRGRKRKAAKGVVGTKVAKRSRKSYLNSSRSWRLKCIRREEEKWDMDPELEVATLARLLRRDRRRRSSTGQERRQSDDFFDLYLSCLNIIKSCNLSMNKWDVLRLCLRDIASRGADLLRLPTSKTLRKYRKKLVPPGLKSTTVTARIPIQSVLTHTAERLCVRPDVKEFLATQPDNARLELLWKWGIDGQTGDGFTHLNDSKFY